MLSGNMMSPPAWGWPAAMELLYRVAEDVPTRVGMARMDEKKIFANV